MKSGDGLEELRALTAQIPQWQEYSKVAPGSVMVELEQAGITCLLWGVVAPENNAVRVMRALCPAGFVAPMHQHKSDEWLIVYKGRMLIRMENKPDYQIGPGQSVHFAPGVAHETEMMEETRFIGVTIPGNAGYPDATD